VECALLLNVVVAQRATVLQLLAGECHREASYERVPFEGRLALPHRAWEPLGALFTRRRGYFSENAVRQRNPHVERYKTTIYVEGTRKVIVPDVFFDLGVIHIINGIDR